MFPTLSVNYNKIKNVWTSANTVFVYHYWCWCFAIVKAEKQAEKEWKTQNPELAKLASNSNSLTEGQKLLLMAQHRLRQHNRYGFAVGRNMADYYESRGCKFESCQGYTTKRVV